MPLPTKRTEDHEALAFDLHFDAKSFASLTFASNPSDQATSLPTEVHRREHSTRDRQVPPHR